VPYESLDLGERLSGDQAIAVVAPATSRGGARKTPARLRRGRPASSGRTAPHAHAARHRRKQPEPNEQEQHVPATMAVGRGGTRRSSSGNAWANEERTSSHCGRCRRIRQVNGPPHCATSHPLTDRLALVQPPAVEEPGVDPRFRVVTRQPDVVRNDAPAAVA
jgi:hypothetical protein